ncbi:MAG: hypothetical protein K2R93_12350 [Gemmatimonadaceae bacterium]|nr:hypothetical protein [Gemmatimonadaceae bacterium]
MSDPLALVYDFEADLSRFGDAVENGATLVLREAGDTTAEAIVIGNQYGPGVPIDTGWARASFVAALNEPAEGRGERPFISRKVNPAGRVLFPETIDLAPIGRAQLGDAIYITTVVEYAQVLEFQPKTRRYGPNAGRSTVFIEPVHARFGAIVDDAADRVGYGRA